MGEDWLVEHSAEFVVVGFLEVRDPRWGTANER